MARRRLPYGPSATLDNVVLLPAEVATDVSDHRLRIGDGVTPGGVATARLDEVHREADRIDAMGERVTGLAGSVALGVRGYEALADLPVLTATDNGALARVEATGAVYRWSGQTLAWVVFDDPAVQAAQSAQIDAGRAESGADRAEAAAATVSVSQKDAPSPEPAVALTSDKDDLLAVFGRTRSVVLDREVLLTPALVPGDVLTDQSDNLVEPRDDDLRRRNIQSVRQMNARSLHLWRRVAARVRTGLGQRLAIIGDSTSAGQNTGTGAGGYVGARRTCWPTRLAEVLDRRIEAQSQSWCGGGNIEISGAAQGQYDDRLVLGSGWQAVSSAAPGGRLYSSDSATTDLNFTPDEAWDKATLWIANASGAFKVLVGSTEVQTVAANTGSSLVGFSITAPSKAIQSLTVRPTTTTAVRVLGAETRDSAKPALEVINMGWAGSTTLDWVSQHQPWAAMRAVDTMDVDAVLICLGINDWISFYNNPSDYITPTMTATNLRTIANRLSKGGTRAVALATPLPGDVNVRVTQGLMRAYCDAVRDLAADMDLPLIDLAESYGSWMEANTMGWADDGIHYNRTAQADIAAQVGALIV